MYSIKINNWQQSLVEAVTNPIELFEVLELDIGYFEAAVKACQLFKLKVPRSFIARMKKKDLNDPLLRQVLPLGEELNPVLGYSVDPLGEEAVNVIPGLLHKYQGRVLFIFAGTCAVNCRYCFRRHFDYEQNNQGTSGWEKALDYIKTDSTISEIILSGGDPLVAKDSILKQFINKLIEIPHVRRLRIHSRLPIVLPERITDEFIDVMTFSHLQSVLVMHCNHPQEINEEVTEVMLKLKKAGITLLNQSVLLKRVNDDVTVLANLSEKLFECGILPYYLHLLDKVQGAAHFDVDKQKAKQLHEELCNRLPGYLVPRLVYEAAGGLSKSQVD